MNKPIKEDYGFVESNSFDEESGWMIESGEEEYYKAYAKWVEFNDMEG